MQLSMVMPVRYAEKTCKSVLGNIGIINTRFWTKHSFDPYDNCEFDCVYCNYATNSCNGSGNPSLLVYAKINAPKVLSRELTHLKRKGNLNIGLAMDPYQPAEEKYRLTKQILEVLKKHNCPFAIGTKSDLVLRDLELIAEAAQKFHCTVSLSIPTLDENLAKLLEPGAPSPKRRLEVMRKFSNARVPTGIWLCPIIPYLTDSKENLANVIEAAVANGAKYILGGALDMRHPLGFTQFLRQHHPRLVPIYDKLYKDEEKRDSHYPNESYLYSLYKLFVSLCKEYGVEGYMPHFQNRKQGMLFYIRNFSLSNPSSIYDLLSVLNYLPPTQELLQTVKLRWGNFSLSKSFLKIFRYFPH